jgi:hypothetical protein
MNLLGLSLGLLALAVAVAGTLNACLDRLSLRITPDRLAWCHWLASGCTFRRAS